MKNKLLCCLCVLWPAMASADYLDNKISVLTQQKLDLIDSLEKCQKSTGAFKIAGIATLGVSAIGVGANVTQAKKIKTQNAKISNLQDTQSSLDTQIADKNAAAAEKAQKAAAEKAQKVIEEEEQEVIEEEEQTVIEEEEQTVIEEEEQTVIEEKAPKVIEEEAPKVIEEEKVVLSTKCLKKDLGQKDNEGFCQDDCKQYENENNCFLESPYYYWRESDSRCFCNPDGTESQTKKTEIKFSSQNNLNVTNQQQSKATSSTAQKECARRGSKNILQTNCKTHCTYVYTYSNNCKLNSAKPYCWNAQTNECICNPAENDCE